MTSSNTLSYTPLSVRMCDLYLTQSQARISRQFLLIIALIYLSCFISDNKSLFTSTYNLDGHAGLEHTFISVNVPPPCSVGNETFLGILSAFSLFLPLMVFDYPLVPLMFKRASGWDISF